MNLSDSEVRTLQMYSWGVRPLSLFSRRAKKYGVVASYSVLMALVKGVV